MKTINVQPVLAELRGVKTTTWYAIAKLSKQTDCRNGEHVFTVQDYPRRISLCNCGAVTWEQAEKSAKPE